ncbi:hypothetical protein [Sinosporangium siamense]|uniref:Uncharacterized protein n=1 Tax=Sinosporangium siamense TaxID=1367973 RepID=A0A919RPF1_9ACTN|nr:hypothetical protein [Sinosporangium siamense]GII97313.1 hypothetical protein Ssi02_75440 [Sinosporangium siamense]
MASWLLRHRVFVVAMALGSALRLMTMLGFGPALWFNDSYEYVSVALHPERPHPIRPNGYGFLLLILEPFHSFTLVVFLQHLMGLATAVLVYALLVKRFDLPGWGATLAAVPVLFDAYQIQLEQLVMSDTMFTLLVMIVITLVLWKRRMTWKTGVTVGLLLALTALTRSIGLAILGLVVVYLLMKRAGWRPVTAVVTATAIPVVAYMMWFNSAYGKFAMTNSDGLILYMRTSVFADCNKMKLEPDTIPLCVQEPAEKRKPYSQWYLWGYGWGEVLHRFGPGKFRELNNDAGSKFAREAITSQPLDYLGVVARDFFRSFHWGRPVFPDPNTFNLYEFPAPDSEDRVRVVPLRNWPTYKGWADTDAFAYEQGSPSTRVTKPWADIMRFYQDVFYLRGIMLGGILLIGLYGVAVRWRGLGGPVLLPWLAAVGLLLAPAAMAEFDYRYLLPAVPLACVAAAVTLRHGGRATWALRLLRLPRTTKSTQAKDAPQAEATPQVEATGK